MNTSSAPGTRGSWWNISSWWKTEKPTETLPADTAAKSKTDRSEILAEIQKSASNEMYQKLIIGEMTVDTVRNNVNSLYVPRSIPMSPTNEDNFFRALGHSDAIERYQDRELALTYHEPIDLDEG